MRSFLLSLILVFNLTLANEIVLNSYEKLPESFLKNLEGKKVSITELNTAPMLINFWFMACEPCKKEMVYLDMFHSKYKKYGFKVVSINTDNSRTLSRVKPYINSKKYSFEVLSDPRSLFFRKIGGKICPTSLLVDQNGNIINKHMGYNPGDEKKLEQEIFEMLINEIKADTVLTDSSIIKLLDNYSVEN